MSGPVRPLSIRGLFLLLGAVGLGYVLAVTLQIGLVLAPTAGRLEARTVDLLEDHDRIAGRLAELQEILHALDLSLSAGAGSHALPADLTGRLRTALRAGIAMRASVERPALPADMRPHLAQAVQLETAAEMQMLAAVDALGLDRREAADQARQRAALLLDSTATALGGAQRTAIADVLAREQGLVTSVRRVTRWAYASVLVGALVLVLTWVLLRRRLYRPIRELERAVDRIAVGDLETRIPVHRDDELGRLATHVNTMTGLLRERAREAVRRHENLEERFGRLLDQSSNEIYLFDAESLRIVQANHGVLVNLGYSAGEMAGLTPADFLANWSRSTLESALVPLRRGEKERLLLTVTHRRKDGTTYPAELTLQYSTAERPPLFVAVAEDISIRSRMRELTERVRQFAFSHHAVIGGGDLIPALQAITAMAADALAVTSATVWSLGADRLRGLGGTREGVSVALEGREIAGRGFGPYLETLVGGSVLAVSDAATDPTTRELVHDPAGRPGVRAQLAVPVRAGGRLLAFLLLEEERRPRSWSPEEEAFGGSVADLIALAMEAAERQGLERLLAQAKKMDSIGRLAGGVAHDFNNLLTAILGHLELARSTLPAGAPARAELDETEQAAQRAAELTRQLLTFARRQVVEPKIVDVNSITRGVERLLRRLIGEDVELVTVLDPGLASTRVDPGQLEQVLVNLAVNARDAMPRGGRLLLETRNAVLDEGYVQTHPEVVPGAYVELAVTDSGTGMDQGTIARLFEPFFTTKEAGRGTGLGLAICYGIVRQAGGYIWVYSEPGRGSTFKVHLPRAGGGAETGDQPRRSVADIAGGTETILVVEDERQIRDIIQRVLTGKGYQVLVAATGEQAMEICAAAERPIELLITDVVLPKLSGTELVRTLRRARPDLPVLYISGYTAEAVADRDLTDPAARFLSKPFTPGDLATRVREVLQLPHGGGGTG